MSYLVLSIVLALHYAGKTEDAVFEMVDALDDASRDGQHPPLEYFDTLGTSFFPLFVFFLHNFSSLPLYHLIDPLFPPVVPSRFPSLIFSPHSVSVF